jgi:putative transposase
MTISKNPSNQYYVSILIEEKFEQTLPNEIKESKVFSADMSAKDFLVSQEMVFENQKHYRKNERTLKIRQRRLSRKQKSSNNRGKEQLKVAKFHQKIVNERRGHQWNLAHELSQKFDVLIFEDLNIKGMQQFNKGVSKTVTMDFSFSEFLSNLEWKCFKENKHFVKIDRWFPSSKLCSSCSQIKSDLTLADRRYVCECGLDINRDINAAINIKNAGISILKKRGINLLKNSTDVNISESYALRDMKRDVSSFSLGRSNSLELGWFTK